MMKRFLSITLFIVLLVLVLVVGSVAADSTTYWSISSDCLVKARMLDDGTVPTFKQVETTDGVKVGLLVGVPADAILNDEIFEAKEGYSLLYVDNNGDEIYASSAHIGTTDKILVYSGDTFVAEYSLVTYGDADGDGYFDVIDASFAALCLNDLLDTTENAAIYESVKLVTSDNMLDV